MRPHTKLRRCSVLAFACGAFALLSTFASVASAQEAPAPVTAPPAMASTAAPPAPVAPGAPVAAAPQTPAARREETEVVAPPASQTPPAGGPPISLASRLQAAVAAARGHGASVQLVNDLRSQITDLQSQLATRDQTIAAQNAELARFRTEHTALQNAIAQLEGARTTVTEEVAALGFPQAQLPGVASLEHAAENTIEGLMEKFKAESDSGKKAEIAAQMRELREKAAKK